MDGNLAGRTVERSIRRGRERSAPRIGASPSIDASQVCPAAQELPAYRLHDARLAEWGLQAGVNWVAVVLDAGCTPRDIHPD